MKLIELNPCWIGSGGEGIKNADGSPVSRREGVGIIFNCPCGCDSKCFIPVDPPLDGGKPLYGESHLWKRTGDTFETLTLTPSTRRIGGCAWHGCITNGEIRNA